MSQLRLKKVGVEDTDKNGAAGAMFELTKPDLNEGKALAFVQNGNTYTYAPDGGTVNKIESQANGSIVIHGLPAGTYKVTETDVLSGYSSNFKAVFNASVAQGTDVASASWNLADGENVLGLATQASGTAPIQVKNVNFKAVFNASVAQGTDVASASWNLADGENVLGLATQASGTAPIQVKNVKSITQLPLTGAAGITMLVVVALLIGGENVLGLATQASGTAPIQVKNVKSITQLPLTGAAGITMLVVVALLIGGAAALIAVRSYSLKQQLRG